MRFPTRRLLAVTAGALLLTGLAVSQKNTTPEAMLRAAMDKETVDGDLKAAIEQYKKVIAQKGASREVVAKALLRLGGTYEKQGSAEARPAYERVVREFADQAEAVQEARARLDASSSKTGGKSLRQICAGADCDGEISPDGRYLSLTKDGNIFVRDLTSGQIRQLSNVPAGTSARAPVWAPDSKRVAYFTAERSAKSLVNRQAVVVNLDGSGTRTVYRGGDSYGWSADGKRLLVATFQGEPRNLGKLMWVGVADGTVQALPTARLNPDVASVSPDGRYIAFNASKDKDSDENVYIMASDGFGETIVSASASYQEPVGWTQDGKDLLFAEYSAQTSLWAVPINGGKPGVPVLAHRDSGSDSFAFRGITRSGAVYYRILTRTNDAFTVSLDPATGKITSEPMRFLAGGGWSPDGRRILHQITGQPTVEPVPDTTGISIYSLDSGQDQRVASNMVVLRRGICWGADGTSILFNRPSGLDSRQSEPVRFSLNTGEATPLFPGASSFTIRTCSEGMVADFNNTAIKVRNLKTGAETEIHKYARRQSVQSSPFLSHDGRSVAFREVLEDGSAALYVVSSEGGAARELARAKPPAEFNNPRGLSWSPDDRFVYFFRRADSKAQTELFRVPAAGGAEESTGLKGLGFGGGEIAPDGKNILFGANGQQPEIWAMENFLPAAK